MVADSIYLETIVWKPRSMIHSPACGHHELCYSRDKLEEHHYKHNKWFLVIRKDEAM